jgi:hypothetical protein
VGTCVVGVGTFEAHGFASCVGTFGFDRRFGVSLSLSAVAAGTRADRHDPKGLRGDFCEHRLVLPFACQRGWGLFFPSGHLGHKERERGARRRIVPFLTEGHPVPVGVGRGLLLANRKKRGVVTAQPLSPRARVVQKKKKRG